LRRVRATASRYPNAFEDQKDILADAFHFQVFCRHFPYLFTVPKVLGRDGQSEACVDRLRNA
jgi:hypothetical protein